MEARENFTQRGRHAAADGAGTDIVLNLHKDWDVVLLPSKTDDPKNKTIKCFEYNGEVMEEGVWWKTLKCSVGFYEDLFKCIWTYPDDPTPVVYESAVIFCKRFGYDKPFFNRIRRLTYKEAFSVEDDSLRVLMFGYINVPDMIENLGYERIDTQGVDVMQAGEMITQMFELLKVNTGSLLSDSMGNDTSAVNYAIRCWCTSTNETHHLWIMDEYATDALTGIASTCSLQEDLIDEVVALKRQGDLFFPMFGPDFDMSRIDPEKPRRALTKDEYFSLLVEQS